MSRGPPDRVKFRVTAVTSEDPDHPVTEVHLLAPHSRGWQSEKFCSYPQEILVDLATATHVHQIQVLSHQHLISTKVDIHIMQKGAGAGAAAGEWQKLGHFVFENNEKSGFSARELKTVKIDRKMTSKLKLSLSRGYVNKHNIYNQVGIISVNLIGWPEDVAGESERRQTEPRSKREHMQVHVGGNRGGCLHNSHQNHHSTRGGSNKVENYALESSNQTGFNVGSQELVSLALDAGIDPFVMHIVREAHKHKQKAVMKEDYEEARRLRDGIERLKLIGRRVAELEGVKQKAVEQEDYENAHVLKKDIDKLRQSCVSLGIGKQGMDAAQAVKLQQQSYNNHSSSNYPKPKIIGGQSSFNSAQSKLSSLGRRSGARKKGTEAPAQAQVVAPTKKELFIEKNKSDIQTQQKAIESGGGGQKEKKIEEEKQKEEDSNKPSSAGADGIDTSTSMTPPAPAPKAKAESIEKGGVEAKATEKTSSAEASAEVKDKKTVADSEDGGKSRIDGPKEQP